MTQAALSIDKASPEPPEPDEGTPRPRHGEPPSWAELMRWRTSPGGRQWMCALGIDANTRSETALLFAWREYERVRQQENARRGELPQLAQATRLPEHLMTIGAAP